MTICLPSQCLLCDMSGTYPIANICPLCFDLMPRLGACCLHCALPLEAGAPVCGACQSHPPPLRQVLAVSPYAEPLSRLIRQLKDQARFATLPLLVSLLEERVRAADVALPDILLPIPMHPWRLLWRGFNQTALIGKRLAPRLGLELDQQLLARRLTPDQRLLSQRARARNIANAFYLKGSVEGLRITLLDDVMTTGATLHSASATLLAAGALRVDAWVIARTLPGQFSLRV